MSLTYSSALRRVLGPKTRSQQLRFNEAFGMLTVGKWSALLLLSTLQLHARILLP